MSARTTLVMLGLVASSSAAGCQAIVGLEDRPTDPILTGCALPTAGAPNTKVRFVNLMPTEGNFDLCIRQSGTDWGRPVLRGGGTRKDTLCSTGVVYLDSTAPFASPAGKVDVKVIKAGSTCDAAPLSQATITVPAGQTMSIVRMGNEKLGEQIKAFPDSTAKTSGSAKTRFIHANAGGPAYDFGVAVSAQARLPTDITDSKFLLDPLNYGDGTNATSRVPGSFTVDPSGYVVSPLTPIPFAVAPTGQKRAVVALELTAAESPRTLYIVGDPAKPYFPVRGLLCDDFAIEGLKTKCTQSPLGTLSVDIFNAYLYGSFAEDELTRREKSLAAIANRPSDLMCITAISRKKDRDKLVELAKMGNFPYAVNVGTDLDTKITNPATATGTIPPPYTTPPCGGAVKPEQVDAALNCIKSKCSTSGDDGGQLQGGSSCISTNCAATLIPFIAGGNEEKRCFNCMLISSLSEATHGETRAQCTTDIRDYKSFRGDNSSMILSKYPISASDTYVYPSTSYLRALHYAKVEIEPSKFIDYYCAELNAAYGELIPYFGHYAAPGAPSGEAWNQEQALQAQRTVEWVKSKSGTNPAIISGDWAASRAETASDGHVIDNQNGPGVFDVLEKDFQKGWPTEGANKYVPHCTECPQAENPYNADLSIWQLKTYTFNMGATAGDSAGLFFTEKDVIVNPMGQPRPLSDRWGFNVQIVRP